jgi:hypothetical protein
MILSLGGSTIFWKESKSNGIQYVSPKGVEIFLNDNMVKLIDRSN